MSITKELRAKALTVDAVIASGDVAAVTQLRTQIDNLRKEVAKLTKRFDTQLDAATQGFAGEDFLKGVTGFISRAARNGQTKAIVVENEADFL